VRSTFLNETYGAKTIRSLVENVVHTIFESCKELGVIISIKDGDFVSITVPQQESDKDERCCIARAIQVADRIQDFFATGIAGMRKEAGVGHDFQFRFVLSTTSYSIRESDEFETVKSFSLMADQEIDTSVRVMDLCEPGEILLISPADHYVAKERTLELSPHRLRGKTKTRAIYQLFKAIPKVG
jgi:hypothetical protein